MAALPVTHIVFFKFKDTASAQEVSNVCNSIIRLKDECIHPETNKPYILSVTGGTDNSPLGLQNGLTHAVIFQFASAADRDYYMHTDPAHTRFGGMAKNFIERAQVIDFTKDVFVDLRGAGKSSEEAVQEVAKEQIVEPEVRYGGDIGKTEVVGADDGKSGAVGMSG